MRKEWIVSSPPPSKNRENQDAATMTRSQPSTSEEVEARAGRPATAGPRAGEQGIRSPGPAETGHRDGHPFGRSDHASDEDVAERAAEGGSHRSESDR